MCVCGFANELCREEKWGWVEVPHRIGCIGGEKPKFNLTGLGCRDITSEQMIHNIKYLMLSCSLTPRY